MCKSITTYLERTAQRYFPRLFYYLIQKPRFRRRFKAERQLAKGQQINDNNHRSILFFTHPKCASRFVHSILVQLAVAEGMSPIDFDAYVTVDPPPAEYNPFSLQGSMALAFQKQGYYYGAMGSFRPIPQFHEYLAVLNLRDPRDVLTSLYFSTAYSHAVISPKLIRRREKARAMSVDQFALANSEQVLKAYGQYCEELQRRKIKLLRYEHMVSDFDRWLESLAKATQLEHHAEVLTKIKAEANFETGREDKYSQRRQVTPGDHRRKLKPETIERLNLQFEPVLSCLNYEI